MKIQLKTPITYYGGKQRMLPYLLEKKPESYTLYNEPFCGGAAFFFALPPASVEVLNDTNKELINFYRVIQTRFTEVEKMISVTLHSRALHRDASVVYNNPHLFDEVKRAWALWVLSAQSFSAMLDGSWGYDKQENRTSKLLQTRKDRFTFELAERLQNVQLECSDAIYIIESRDTPTSFHYVDPPYIGSDCGHYDGYTDDDFERLLQSLSRVKGKFLLSSYPGKLLNKYAAKHGWHMWSVEQKVSVNAKSGYLKRKVEVLTANYPI
ncbi:DNA adenine methylase [Limnovirga soli]|uniref:DNA adenine methylase n=1 Tax=Limnovirga soli TaxID=2656915 RepID=A0A8J8JS96_9BACT|nr:DNA adenine methylase [Limnovirga soli]NNV54513.1 DNA adenine methylase [Limnovirga soli]